VVSASILRTRHDLGERGDNVGDGDAVGKLMMVSAVRAWLARRRNFLPRLTRFQRLPIADRTPRGGVCRSGEIFIASSLKPCRVPPGPDFCALARALLIPGTSQELAAMNHARMRFLESGAVRRRARPIEKFVLIHKVFIQRRNPRVAVQFRLKSVAHNCLPSPTPACPCAWRKLDCSISPPKDARNASVSPLHIHGHRNSASTKKNAGTAATFLRREIVRIFLCEAHMRTSVEMNGETDASPTIF